MNLFIDTHLNDVIIILNNNGKIVKEEKYINVKENSKIIMPTIKKILENGKPDSILVVNGPGSFTGVRLGVTIAKTLAMTLSIPIKTITSLECLAVSLNSPEKIVGFSDKNGYYIGVFNQNNELIGSYEYLSNVEFLEYRELHKVNIDIELNYENIFAYADKLNNVNYHQVKPIYIKKIDVEK